MKTIGLIGGMSWESSKIYYEVINQRVKELLGGNHSCKSIMLSVDFVEIEKLTVADDWEGIGALMADSARQLEQAGGDIVLLCTNTIHIVSDAIVNAVDIPFMHIAEATGTAIKSSGLKKVALLGTRFTMEKDFYTKILEEQYGLEVIIPALEERQLIHDIIYQELVKGQFTDSSREKCLQIIQNLKDLGAQGVIMGCTELPILIPEEQIDLPSFDTGKIHAHKAVDWALNSH